MVRRLLDDSDATGFALYPAKALAADQLVRWREAFRAAGLDEDLVVEIHGDIPPNERDALLMTLPSHGDGYRLCEPIDAATRQRLTGPGAP